MKMRMLNAAHVALGFLGATTAHEYTDVAMRDPALGGAVERLLAEEVQPTLGPVPGIDLDAYRASVLGRLRNPAITDPLERLRRRGSVRVRNYLLPTIERAMAEGRPCPVLTEVVAAWIEQLGRTARALQEGTLTPADAMTSLEDPDASRLLTPAMTAASDVRPLLAQAPGFERLRHHPTFVETLQAALDPAEGARRAAS
jgi:mannitol-1-phosphate/altronate dehydrogenase